MKKEKKTIKEEVKDKNWFYQLSQDWYGKDWQAIYRMLNIVLSFKEPLWDWDKDKTTNNNG